MPNKVKNVKTGVMVKINPPNSKKIVLITKKTHRTFASEVNVAVEEYTDREFEEYADKKIEKCNCGFPDAHHSVEHWPYCNLLKK